MRKRIPWDYDESPFIRLWRWRTKHFDAKIQSDGNSFSYNIAGISSKGARTPLGADIEPDFKSAETAILEIVGKSYPLSLGYRDYAGELATTFRVRSGKTIDFGPYEGMRVALTVDDESGTRIFNGPIRVINYTIEIVSDSGEVLRIPPALVIDIKAEYSKNSSNRNNSNRSGKESRTVRGEAVRGCTGKPGFSDGFVEHPPSSNWCPVHRI